ncbi:MAG: hypothetical protein IH618_10530 [Ignavibacteriaceae bacterium]|nr:hypothetical protein [Ignavibacteriaceae bacterium]
MKYLNQSQVRKLANKHNRRVGKDFLVMLDAMIERKVIQACKTHNGGKKTLDQDIAIYIGVTK